MNSFRSRSCASVGWSPSRPFIHGLMNCLISSHNCFVAINSLASVLATLVSSDLYVALSVNGRRRRIRLAVGHCETVNVARDFCLGNTDKHRVTCSKRPDRHFNAAILVGLLILVNTNIVESCFIAKLPDSARFSALQPKTLNLSPVPENLEAPMRQESLDVGRGLP